MAACRFKAHQTAVLIHSVDRIRYMYVLVGCLGVLYQEVLYVKYIHWSRCGAGNRKAELPAQMVSGRSRIKRKKWEAA